MEQTTLDIDSKEMEKESLLKLFKEHTKKMDELNFHHYSAFRDLTLDAFLDLLVENKSGEFLSNNIKKGKIKAEDVYNFDNWIRLLHNQPEGSNHFVIKVPMCVVDVKNKRLFEANNEEMQEYLYNLIGCLSIDLENR